MLKAIVSVDGFNLQALSLVLNIGRHNLSHVFLTMIISLEL